jgi:hypothetical protein
MRRRFSKLPARSDRAQFVDGHVHFIFRARITIMMGRREFGLAGISAAALVAVEATGLAQAKKKKKADAKDEAHHGMGDPCAAACGACQRSCDSCATHCADLVAGGEKAHLETLRTCQDCATICAAAAQVVARGGPFSDLICTGCAEACARCAKACEQHPGDEHMKECAEECRRCEKECREMLKHVGHNA